MECYYHPNKEGVNTCTICGKSVCEECSLEIAGKMYCKECLEKIVGIGIDNKANNENTEVESKPEPVRLNKKEEIHEEPTSYQAPSEEKTIFARGLNSDLDQTKQDNDNIYAANLQKEESIYDTPIQQDYSQEETINKPISNDSPYNINGMGYSKEINETKKSYFKKESAPYLDQSNNINQDQNIIERQQPQNQYYQRQEPQNEFNQQQPQNQYYQRQEPQNEFNQQQPQNVQNEFDSYQQPQNEFNQYQQQPQSAQNEFDQQQSQYSYQRQEPQDYIFPDHTYEPEETSARQALEDKYEKYLDDLYFDEAEVPLEEQLAKDEEKYGSLTRKPYTPTKPSENEIRQQITQEQGYMPQSNEQQMPGQQQQSYYQQQPIAPNRGYVDETINGQFNIRQEQATKPIHNIKYEEDEKEPFGIVDLILTIILIIAILIVIFYIVYLLFLSANYPTFLDAVFGLQNPGELISNLMN